MATSTSIIGSDLANHLLKSAKTADNFSSDQKIYIPAKNLSIGKEFTISSASPIDFANVRWLAIGKDGLTDDVTMDETNWNNVEDRVVLIVGAIGSGKTSLISNMINYLYNVQSNVDFRFRLFANEHTEDIRSDIGLCLLIRVAD